MFKLPNELLIKKHQLLKLRTILTPGNEKRVHHWVLFQCSSNFEQQYLSTNPLPQPGKCGDGTNFASAGNTNQWNVVSRNCRLIIAAWAVGGILVSLENLLYS